MKKLRLVLCSFLAFILVAVSMPVAANAATKPVCLKKTTLHYQIAGDQTAIMESLYIGNLSSSASITGIKSSNRHFQAMKSQVCPNGIRIDRKGTYVIKDGMQTTISFTVRQNGKAYKLSSRITFKKFDQVFKSFKIGNKDYASAFTGYWYTQTNLRKGNAKIQITPAAGYKIDKITTCYIYANGSYTEKTVKNGARISLNDLKFLYVFYHPDKKPAYYKESKNTEYSPFNYEFHVRPES